MGQTDLIGGTDPLTHSHKCQTLPSSNANLKKKKGRRKQLKLLKATQNTLVALRQIKIMNTKQVLIIRKTDKLHYIKLCMLLCCRREVKRRGQRTIAGLFSQKTKCNLRNQTQIFPIGGKHLCSLDHFIIPKMNSF